MIQGVWWRAQARRARLLSRLVWACAQDAWSYARGSGLLDDTGRQSSPALNARVLKTAHRLDKGLALPRPRRAFGLEVAALLRGQLHALETAAVSNDGGFRQDSTWVFAAACASLQRHGAMVNGAAVQTLAEPQDAATVQAQARAGYAALVRSRRSVRRFAGSPLPAGVLWRAAELARHAPSVCNRAGGRVWVATDVEVRQRLLRHQDGHQGFAEDAAAIALITVDTRVFHTVGERHQAWVDGGLFAMTFVHALHEEGLGTCCLNWSVEPAADRALKRDAGIPPGETVVMMVAIGPLQERYTVAYSPRRPVEEVLRSLDSLPSSAVSPPSRDQE